VYSRLDDEVLVRCGASSQPVRVTPRQPYGQSLVDPAASTRAFGSAGQREVTVVKRGRDKPVVEALISGGDSNWSWPSVEQLGQAVDELVRGPISQSLSSQGSLSAANVEVEELSPLVVNAVQSQSPASLPLQPFTDQAQSSVCQREPCRPVCHCAPLFESHVDRDPPAHRRAEFPAVDGAVYSPPVATSTCGPQADSGRVGQPTAGFGESYGQRHGQRDVGNVVKAESQSPVAAATDDPRQPDYRIGQLRRDPAVVYGSNSRDVKESGAAFGLARGRASVADASPSVPSDGLGVGNVNVVLDPDRQQYVVTGRSLRPDSASFMSVTGRSTVQRQPRGNGQNGTYYSCPVEQQWSNVVNVGDSPRLSPIMEVRHPSVDNPVVVGQPSMVTGDNGRQRQPVADPSAVVMVDGMDPGQQPVCQSSASHGEQRQSRDGQQRPHRGHHGGDSPDSSPDDSGTDRSGRSSRHGHYSRGNRQHGDRDKQSSKDRSPAHPGEQPGGRSGDNGQRDNPDRSGGRRRRPDRGGRRGDQPPSPDGSSSSSRSRSRHRRHKHWIKPDKYDGQSSLEGFLMVFENAA